MGHKKVGVPTAYFERPLNGNPLVWSLTASGLRPPKRSATHNCYSKVKALPRGRR
jgi:hypothetical protein